MVVEYVAAPAPDIEELIQAAPSSSARGAAAADGAADAAMEDDDGGYGGLGLGATAGLGSTAGLGAGGGALGLGFRKADEPPPVDPEVSWGSVCVCVGGGGEEGAFVCADRGFHSPSASATMCAEGAEGLDEQGVRQSNCLRSISWWEGGRSGCKCGGQGREGR